MIGRLYLRNVGPFRGEHALELGPGAYAVVARHEDNARRSNALGKSMLAEAIRFCVTGAWPQRRGDADGWISDGEREACAALFLEDGAAIERTKRRGKPREARARLPGSGMREAFGDDATASLLRHLRFETAREFSETCYVEQKKADAFMNEDPLGRLRVVSGWLGLGAAERAAARADDDLEAATARVDAAQAGRDRLEVQAAATMPDPEPHEQQRLDRREEARALGEHLGVVMAGLAAGRAIAAHKETVRKGRALREEIDANPPPAGEDLRAASEALVAASGSLGEAERDEREKRKTAAGEFDGACPVAGIACPAKGEINADRLLTRRNHAAARARLEAARKGADEARALALEVDGRQAAHASRQGRLEDLRADIRRSRDAVAADVEVHTAAAALVERLGHPSMAVASSALQDQVAAANRAAGVAEGLRDAARGTRVEIEAATAALAGAEGILAAAIAARTRTAHAAQCVRAAQRRVAERALSTIERGANAALEEAGVEMRLRARWEREGKDPARHCDECGWAYPRSARVKACERCGAARGKNAVQRLDLVADGSSGGLDDLGGAAWQHAAGAWLLRARTSPWSTCVLDEPTAHLDHPSRQGLVRYLNSAMRRGAFRQTIMVSHAAETVEAMQRKIVITCSRGGERRIEVIS